MSNNLFNLEGKVILVTGGYGHLGRAICEALISQNAIVYILGRDRSKFENINFKKIKSLKFEELDISKSENIDSIFNKIYNIEKKIDVLINNAIYISGSSPEKMSDEDWGNGLDGVLSSVFKTTRSVIPYMKKNQSGKIINVASMYGIIAPDFDIYEDNPNYLNPPHYGAAKAGVIQLTKYYASYLGKENINVNCVSPGPFPSVEVMNSKNFISMLENKTCLNRVGRPEDLSGLFVFLCSDSSNYITGQNIIIDGGWTIKS